MFVSKAYNVVVFHWFLETICIQWNPSIEDTLKWVHPCIKYTYKCLKYKFTLVTITNSNNTTTYRLFIVSKQHTMILSRMYDVVCYMKKHPWNEDTHAIRTRTFVRRFHCTPLPKIIMNFYLLLKHILKVFSC